MNKLEQDYVLQVASTIWRQLLGTSNSAVMGSWGIQNLTSVQILVEDDNYQFYMPALKFNVNGFQYKGTICVVYDIGADYYRIYTMDDNENIKKIMEDICFDELSEKLDTFIEKGQLSDVEYSRRVKEYIMSI